MPKELLANINKAAREDNRSRSNWIVTELTDSVRKRGAKNTIEDVLNPPIAKFPHMKTDATYPPAEETLRAAEDPDVKPPSRKKH